MTVNTYLMKSIVENMHDNDVINFNGGIFETRDGTKYNLIVKLQEVKNGKTN